MTVPRLQVFEDFPQELAIEVSGPDVLLLAGNRPQPDPSPDEAFPDPVELFVGALNQQMFPGTGQVGCLSSARILSRSADLGRSTQTWHLRIDHAHPSCLRVLANVLAARDFDAVEMRGTPSRPQARRLDALAAAYPPARPKFPFIVEREEGNRAFSDRLIQIEFAHPPTDQSIEAMFAVLELWCDLMLLGGYPPEDLDARESGVLPDGPLLFDEVTVQMAFPEAFQVDEAAFNCVLNHLTCAHQDGEPVALVRIR